MKIVLTAGGSGGHFYPLMAVADKIREESEKQRLIKPKIYYLANDEYNRDLLFKNEIEFRKVYAGKLKRGGGISNLFSNFFDMFKTFFGFIRSFLLIYKLYPDVIFSNGGYVAFPVLLSAKLLRIPVFIHNSDTVPSRVTLFASKFAKKVSIAFPESIEHLKHVKKERIALLGNPVRDQMLKPLRNGAHEFLELDYNIPTLFILGGSQGAKTINDVIIDAAPEFLNRYNIIHQTGKDLHAEVKARASVVLYNHKHVSRYKIFPYLDLLAMRMAAGASDIIITRSGAGSISEISNWGIPSIMVPIPESISRDQENNAFAYARNGAALVIKQKNLTAGILVSEIDRLMEKRELRDQMAEAAKDFSRPDAADKIAQEIIKVALSHL